MFKLGVFFLSVRVWIKVKKSIKFMDFVILRGNKSLKLVFKRCRMNYVKIGCLRGMFKLLRLGW